MAFKLTKDASSATLQTDQMMSACSHTNSAANSAWRAKDEEVEEASVNVALVAESNPLSPMARLKRQLWEFFRQRSKMEACDAKHVSAANDTSTSNSALEVSPSRGAADTIGKQEAAVEESLPASTPAANGGADDTSKKSGSDADARSFGRLRRITSALSHRASGVASVWRGNGEIDAMDGREETKTKRCFEPSGNRTQSLVPPAPTPTSPGRIPQKAAPGTGAGSPPTVRAVVGLDQRRLDTIDAYVEARRIRPRKVERWC